MTIETSTEPAPKTFTKHPAIETDIASSFTYVSYQNAIPVIRSIRLANFTGQNLEGMSLDLVADPPFLRAKTWVIDRLLHGDDIVIGDRKVDLDPSYFNGLNEA